MTITCVYVECRLRYERCENGKICVFVEGEARVGIATIRKGKVMATTNSDGDDTRMADAHLSNKHVDVMIHASNGVSLYQFCLPLFRQLQQSGYRVLGFAKYDNFFSLLAKSGVPVESSDSKEDAIGPLAIIKYLKNLISVLRRSRPTILHCMSPKAILLATIPARLMGIRVLCTLTGLGYSYTLRWYHPIRIITSKLYRLVLPCAKAVVFLNTDDYRLFAKRRMVSPSKMSIIRSSGVDVDRYARNNHPYPQIPTFIFVGRLLFQKGIITLLQAATQLMQYSTNWKLYIVGSTQYGSKTTLPLETLQRYLEPLGQCAEYVGSVTDVAPWLCKSSVLVLPTYYREGVPQSILEAMACGLAVITTTMPGSRETVFGGRNGILISPKDAGVLCEAMLRFVHNPEMARHMGEEGIALVRKHFSTTLVNDATIATYKRIGLKR